MQSSSWVPRGSRKGSLDPSRRALVLALALLGGCGRSDTTAPGPAEVSVSPTAALLLTVGSTVRFDATVAAGSSDDVVWSSSNPSVATVQAGLATAVSAGVTTIETRLGSAVAAATLEVYLAEPVAELVPGRTYRGRGGYAELIAGELPLVFSSPHGGEMTPGEIPDRTVGVTGNDLNTQELTRAVREALIERTGRAPYVVISRLRRVKLDPNREVVEAAAGNVFAEQAWAEYHGFIDLAKARIVQDHGAGLYIDMHGHGHEIARLELGYLLSSSDLANADVALDRPTFANRSSLRALHQTAAIPFSALVRGPSSLGSLMEDRGYRAVPSATDPAPGNAPYFTGGYSTARHGSREDGMISGIQIEHWRVGIRDTEANRRAYAAELADALVEFFESHYGVELSQTASHGITGEAR